MIYLYTIKILVKFLIIKNKFLYIIFFLFILLLNNIPKIKKDCYIYSHNILFCILFNKINMTLNTI